MASQEVGDLLEECVRAAQQSGKPTEAEGLKYRSFRGQTQGGAIWSLFFLMNYYYVVS